MKPYAAALALLTLGTAQATHYPLTITDDTGHALTLTHAPKRLVSMLPSHTETLIALGAGKQLVGIDTFSNYPADVTAHLPKVGSGYSPNLEAIAALKPDLVLVGETRNGLGDKLRALGLKVYAGQAQTFNETFAKIALLGKITNHEAAATRLATVMRRDMNTLQSSVQSLKPVSVYYEVDPAPYAAGQNSFIGTLIQKAGGRNIIPAKLGDFPKISPELVLTAAPQVIIGIDAAQASKRPGWASIPAIKSGRVYTLSQEDNDAVVRPGPRLPQALSILIQRLHPEARGPK